MRVLARDSANQAPPFEDVNLFSCDRALQDSCSAAGLGRNFDELRRFGQAWGTAESFELGRLANENPPKFVPVAPDGERFDEVEFHPAYHELMRRSMAAGLHCSTWTGASHALRAVQLYMAYQVESGHICPLTMTHASQAALSFEPSILADWRPLICSRAYDSRSAPRRAKSAATIGMTFTERQGGTDLRAVEARATRRGDVYVIEGEKWFMSAPMSDAFVTLAQADGGLTAFLAPRVLPNGERNGIRLQRLKDKLGDRSNASAEIVLESTLAERIGPEGGGLRIALAMAQTTRLDCAVASAGLMRSVLARAIHHARHRRAFGKPLIAHPAMRAILADLALESEACTALAIRLARARDDEARDPLARAYVRIMTPAIKFFICKLAPSFVYECMECFGGNGYVEDWPLARAYRQAPVNAIWEGAGNVMALDILRAASRDPSAYAALLASLNPPEWGEWLAAVPRTLAQGSARAAAERLARAAALSALRESAPAIADIYHQARLAPGPRSGWGCFDFDGRESVLLERAPPL